MKNLYNLFYKDDKQQLVPLITVYYIRLIFTCTVEPAMSSHSYEQPTSYGGGGGGGHLANPQNDISYTNEPPMSSPLH